MGVLDIDHENIVVKKHTVMNRVVYTFDNFYKYPKLVRANYHKFKDKSTVEKNNFYPGKRLHFTNSFTNQEIREHMDDLKRLICSHGFDNSRFVHAESDFQTRICEVSFSVCSDEGANKPYAAECLKDRSNTSNPHTDSNPLGPERNNKLACLCYLSKDIHGGTGLYYNKRLQTFCTDAKYEDEDKWNLWKKVQAVTTDSEKLVIIRNHYTDRSKNTFSRPTAKGFMNKSDEYFDLLHFFPMRFNRLIAYEGDIMHSMYIEDDNFYKVHERLTSNYFLDIYWDEIKNKLISKSDEEKLKKIINSTVGHLGTL